MRLIEAFQYVMCKSGSLINASRSPALIDLRQERSNLMEAIFELSCEHFKSIG